jgi:hypothetical protein
MNFSSGTVAVAVAVAGADVRDVDIVFTPGHLRYSKKYLVRRPLQIMTEIKPSSHEARSEE